MERLRLCMEKLLSHIPMVVLMVIMRENSWGSYYQAWLYST